MPKRLHGNIEIDFGRFGVPAQSGPVEVTFDDAGRPLRAELTVPRVLWNRLTEPGQRNFAFLNGTTIAGRCSGGRALTIHVGAATDLGFAASDDLVLSVEPRSVTLDAGTGGAAPIGTQWRFRLVNFGFRTGDIPSPRPVPKRYERDASVSGGWSLDRIDFAVAGRTCSLKDDSLAPRPSTTNVERLRADLLCHILQTQVQQKGWVSWSALRTGAQLLWTVGRRCVRDIVRSSRRKRAAPPQQVETGVLSVPAQAGETAAQVQAMVRDILTLLSFGLCTAVDWAECSLIDKEGRVLWRECRHARTARFDRGQARIDQDPPQTGGVIRGFLEECYPQLAANRKRLTQTVGVYVEAQLSDTTLKRAALLNMLLDRLQKQINDKQLGPQIDAELDARIDRKEFKGRLNALLSELSGNWSKELTGKVISEIKRFNAGPGFGKAVRLAFESLGIRGFDTLPLGTRHVVLHDAELPLPLEEVVPYLTELDLLVFLLIARLLGYTRQFFHPHLGAETKRIDALMAAGDATAPPASL